MDVQTHLNKTSRTFTSPVPPRSSLWYASNNSISRTAIDPHLCICSAADLEQPSQTSTSVFLLKSLDESFIFIAVQLHCVKIDFFSGVTRLSNVSLTKTPTVLIASELIFSSPNPLVSCVSSAFTGTVQLYHMLLHIVYVALPPMF